MFPSKKYYKNKTKTYNSYQNYKNEQKPNNLPTETQNIKQLKITDDVEFSKFKFNFFSKSL